MSGPADGPSPVAGRAALDELSRLLLAGENIDSVLQRVVVLVGQGMPAGAEASITVVRRGQATTAAFSGALAADLDETQHELGHGPCLEAALSGRSIEITDARTEDRWPEFMPAFVDRGALSALAVPVSATQLSAGLNVYAPVAGAFSDQHRQLATEFATYAGVALTNLGALHDALDQVEHMRAAMESRAAIEQAKGILIERYRLTPDQAFRLLADASMQTNRKVRDLAGELVLTGELPGSRPPDDASTPRAAAAEPHGHDRGDEGE
jgi:GAF domain-containing protein